MKDRGVKRWRKETESSDDGERNRRGGRWRKLKLERKTTKIIFNYGKEKVNYYCGEKAHRRTRNSSTETITLWGMVSKEQIQAVSHPKWLWKTSTISNYHGAYIYLLHTSIGYTCACKKSSARVVRCQPLAMRFRLQDSFSESWRMGCCWPGNSDLI